MGGFNSKFVIDSNSQTAVAGYSHPNKANWITAHAITTELSIAEVERLWKRFQQLGCDRNGVIPKDKLDRNPYVQDAFFRNILKQFKSTDESISFETFIRAMKWIELQDHRSKARATYQMLNNGAPINKELLTRIMKRVYPEDSKEDIERSSSMFFTMMDVHGRGQINEDNFVDAVMRLPPHTLNGVFSFCILPDDMREKVHRNLPEMSSRVMSHRDTALTPATHPPTYRPTTISPQGRMTVRQVPSDEILQDIATKIHRRDWDLLANRLGMLQEDVQGFRDVYPRSTFQQALSMLRDWKRKEGMNARADILDRALRDANMPDAAMVLGP